MNIIYATHQHCKVAYWRTAPAARTLVFLHGFCEDSRMWLHFAKELQRDFCIIGIDLSGFGKSDLLPDTSIDTMAQAVQAVLAHAQVEKCVIVGHSMGGYVGLAFAEHYPQQLQGLGLFHSHPFADSEERRTNRHKSIQFIQRHGVAPFVGQLFPSLFAPHYARAHRYWIDELISQASELLSDAIIAATRAMIERPDRSSTLAALACPALFIIGTEDKAIAAEQSLAQTHLPNIADIHLLPNVGHMGMYEHRTATIAIVQRFAEWVCALPSHTH